MVGLADVWLSFKKHLTNPPAVLNLAEGMDKAKQIVHQCVYF